MKERPIIFSTPMIQAILAGEKTQTRRILKDQPSEEWGPEGYGELHGYDKDGELSPDILLGYGAYDYDGTECYLCKHGAPGDLLWVRETWRHTGGNLYQYKATYPNKEGQADAQGWRSPIFMPRKASRITLEILSIRAERLEDISEQDAIAEGAPLDRIMGHGRIGMRSHREGFIGIWLDIYGTWLGPHNPLGRSPWVWVIEFKRVEKGGQE